MSIAGPAAGSQVHRIATHGLQLCAGGRTLLGPLDAAFEAGRVTAVLGPNGAGKSTLLGALSQWRRPDAGRIDWQGTDLQALPAAGLARQRALVAQDTASAFDFRVHELVELGSLPHPRRAGEALRVERALEACGLRTLRDRGVASLSGGERARVHLARALVQVGALDTPPPGAPPCWLLLDEPTAALDLQHQHAMLALVRRCAKESGMGVITVLHDLNLALRYADDALVLAEGRACAQGPARAVIEPGLVARVWRVRCQAVAGADAVPQLLLAA
ncbi:ATP-binding cassette domain-containing protein [Aquincola sp. MAHUQ-54]|uniref:ATP-binding cassette domain-containing protein n=1 Tax=Aquincola agrisoli TaxID=3119538 RepID=A0AAW9QF66_9BURK